MPPLLRPAVFILEHQENYRFSSGSSLEKALIFPWFGPAFPGLDRPGARAFCNGVFPLYFKIGIYIYKMKIACLNKREESFKIKKPLHA